MTTLRHEIQIAAPVDRVWSLLSDLTAVQHYNPTVRAARMALGPTTGAGAERVCDLHPKGQVTERVTVWEPGRSLGLEVTKSDWPIVFMRWKTSLDPLGQATRVSQTLDYQVKFGPFGALLDAMVMRRKLNAAIADVFQRMKLHVEKRHGDPA